MKKDEIVKISNTDMEFIKTNQNSECPVVQAMIDRMTGMGPEIDILPAGFGQNNPIQDLNTILTQSKKSKKVYKDKEGNVLKPIKKINSFGHVFIVFKYENSKCFRIVRKDRLRKTLNVISN
jgi:hypothetical protein